MSAVVQEQPGADRRNIIICANMATFWLDKVIESSANQADVKSITESAAIVKRIIDKCLLDVINHPENWTDETAATRQAPKDPDPELIPSEDSELDDLEDEEEKELIPGRHLVAEQDNQDAFWALGKTRFQRVAAGLRVAGYWIEFTVIVLVKGMH